MDKGEIEIARASFIAIEDFIEEWSNCIWETRKDKRWSIFGVVKALLGDAVVVDPDVLEILGFWVNTHGTFVDGNAYNKPESMYK